MREGDPELFIRYRYKPLYYESVEKIARFIGSKPENLVLVDNATGGEFMRGRSGEGDGRGSTFCFMSRSLSYLPDIG